MQQTNAFQTYKKQTQTLLDFSVLVTTAVPFLQQEIEQSDTTNETQIPNNKDFKGSFDTFSTEERMFPIYKTFLGANLLLTCFSFFESYFFAAIDEIIAFHGGEEEYLEFLYQRISSSQSGNEKLEKPLKKKHNKAHELKYKKYSHLLDQTDFVWPSDRLAYFGLSQIITTRAKWTSSQIPDLIQNILTLSLTEQEVSKFHNLRNKRNKIAHGKRLNYELEKAKDAALFLFHLAEKVDLHICQHFLIIEKYRG